MEENTRKRLFFDIAAICFRLICIVFTIGIVLFWIYQYSLNLDLCRVDFKNYHHSKQDVFPLLSLCFKDLFLEDKLLEYNTSVASYIDYLNGKNYPIELNNLPYDNITMDMDRYVMDFFLQTTNGSYRYFKKKKGQKLLNISYDGFWFDSFYRCFALNIPQEKTIQGLGVKIKSDIFRNGISLYRVIFLIFTRFYFSYILNQPLSV